jgi:hypothetical protein
MISEQDYYNYLPSLVIVELPQHALAAFRYHQCLVGEFTIAIEDIIDETLLRIQDKEDADDQVEDMYDTLGVTRNTKNGNRHDRHFK